MSAALLPHLRASRPLARFVLAAYVLLIAVAGIAPWTDSAAMGLVCSAAARADAGADAQQDDHALRCALCLPLQLTASTARATVPPLPAVWSPAAAAPHSFPALASAALPPARGPPSV